MAIPAADFHRKNESENDEIITIEGIGIENKAIQFGDPLKRNLDPLVSSELSVEYDFLSFNAGWIKVYIYALPTFPLHSLEKATYSFTIDEQLVFRHDIAAEEYSDEWKQNVLSNTSLKMSEIFLDKPGKHTLKIKGDSQGIIIQKIVIDFGGLKESYLGPESSRVH